MKAKILGFCFSLLLFASAKSQTIDGKLYTNFNNYYKWRGGAFDTTLLIPNTPSSNGKRPGALYYNTTDSSVYSWTGSQWQKVGATIDTSSLSNRINLKLNISDTASMLNPYMRSNVAAATFVDSVFIQTDSLRYRKGSTTFTVGKLGGGADVFAYTAKTTTYTAQSTDYVIHCTSGTFTVNLPTAVGITGKVYIVKNSGTGLITIDPNGSQTIDGALTYKIGINESLHLISTGANWITL